MQLKKIKSIMRLQASLLCLLLLASCATTKNNCPSFPVIPYDLAKKLDKIAETDVEAREWGNKLLDLCEELEGNCDFK